MNNKAHYKVLIIGDQCLDQYTYCSCEKLSPEAPVPILQVHHSTTAQGMSANVENNLKSLGIETFRISNKNIITKQRFIDYKTNHQFFRLDNGDEKTQPLDKEDLKNIDWSEFNAVVISDYNKGFLTYDIIQYISNSHPLTFLDTKKKFNSKFENITWIKINEEEYKNNKPLKTDIYFKTIITRGKKGATLGTKQFPTEQVSIMDVVGAGDTFLAGLVSEYLKSNNINSSIDFANKCATQVVQKRGTSIVNFKKNN